MATIRIQREDFDAGAEVARLSEGRRDIGAVVSFVGLCATDFEATIRNDEDLVTALKSRRYRPVDFRQRTA